MTHNQTAAPERPADAPVEVLATGNAPLPAWLRHFHVKRSGANITLICRPCNRPCGSWRVLLLPDLVATAANHRRAMHAAQSAGASR